MSPPPLVLALIIPGLRTSNLDQKWNFRQENKFHVWNWKRWWGTESKLCIQVGTPVKTWLVMLVKQDGWNEEKGFVGGRDTYNAATRKQETGSRESLRGDREIIVFGSFLLDCVPIKLNTFDRGEKLMMRGDGEGRYRWKGWEGKEKKSMRLLHYWEQLLGTVSYGICCTKCHVALLHWGSVWRKGEIINHKERRIKWGGGGQQRIRRAPWERTRRIV